MSDSGRGKGYEASFNTSRGILKWGGIFKILSGVYFLLRALVYLSAASASDSLPVDIYSAVNEAIDYLYQTGVIVLIDGILSLFHGLTSYIASKDWSYGRTAWIFSILSGVYGIGRLISLLVTNFSKQGVIGAAFITAVSLLMFFAAYTVMKISEEKSKEEL